MIRTICQICAAIVASIWLAGFASASAQIPQKPRIVEPEPYPSTPPHSLRAVIDTEGVPNAYSEIYFYGNCADVTAKPARATFNGHGEHRTLTIANPCVGEWHRSGGRGPLPGLALTPHPGDRHFAASIEFGAYGRVVGRYKYTLTVTYADQRVTAKITAIVTTGNGAHDRGSAIIVATH